METNKFKERFIQSLPEMPEGLDLRLDEFHIYDLKNQFSPLLNSQDREHLVSVGFPVRASPFLSFSDSPDWDYKADLYFPIGADGSGNTVCIDLSNREVVLLDHDWGMKRVFINSSLDKFAECLCIYQEALSNKNLDACLNKMINEDSRLSAEGEWWVNEINNS